MNLPNRNGGSSPPGFYSILRDVIVNMGQGRVAVNSCCYAAGSRYIIDGRLTDPSAQAHKTSFDVTPRLCNKDGIPYGYAVVEFYDGTIHYDHGFRNYLYPARRLDTACP